MIQHFLDYIAIERKYSQRTVDAYHDDLRDFCRFMGWEIEDFKPNEAIDVALPANRASNSLHPFHLPRPV